MPSPLPTPASLEHRARIAALISPLRPVRARVPFYQLAAHRIPTLWSLYRGLLRESPTKNIRSRIVALFRQHQHFTGAKGTRTHLLTSYKWLDIFTRAKRGDEHLTAILLRYDKLLSVRQEKERWRRIYRNEIAWQRKLRNRPILTGGFFRASFFNKPLPRMKPQPLAVTMMIKKRRAKRERRVEKLSRTEEWRDDLRRESTFEDELARHTPFQSVYKDSFADWDQPLMQVRTDIRNAFKRDIQRFRTPYTPELLETIKQARREKIANKTRELERERRGEILPRTIRRRNQGPPAHVLRTMSPKQQMLDKVVRSVSEVGYVAHVKRQLGFKPKDPEAWKKEIGTEEDKGRLDRLMVELRRENEKRRKASS